MVPCLDTHHIRIIPRSTDVGTLVVRLAGVIGVLGVEDGSGPMGALVAARFFCFGLGFVFGLVAVIVCHILLAPVVLGRYC